MAGDEMNAGFTVKEMLVRVEAKVDVILADHEARLRKIENSDALAEGGSNNNSANRARVVAWFASLAAVGQIAYDLFYFTHH